MRGQKTIVGKAVWVCRGDRERREGVGAGDDGGSVVSDEGERGSEWKRRRRGLGWGGGERGGVYRPAWFLFKGKRERLVRECAEGGGTSFAWDLDMEKGHRR